MRRKSLFGSRNAFASKTCTCLEKCPNTIFKNFVRQCYCFVRLKFCDPRKSEYCRFSTSRGVKQNTLLQKSISKQPRTARQKFGCRAPFSYKLQKQLRRMSNFLQNSLHSSLDTARCATSVQPQAASSRAIGCTSGCNAS